MMARDRQGLSPLARGNLHPRWYTDEVTGPIPARTGQPTKWLLTFTLFGAYPRSHGATDRVGQGGQPSCGLSPLARGNLQRVRPLRCAMGPIPARTGQPYSACNAQAITGAYPRSHGATPGPACRRLRPGGLSPLARGNLGAAVIGHGAFGPIPARTGQPGACFAGSGARWAYPRSHGATCKATSPVWPSRGLSPLARGNLRGTLGAKLPCWAYPRSHGATVRPHHHRGCEQGLSPLARGNPAQTPRLFAPAGPIPARTGQPIPNSPVGVGQRAYPRSHGATRIGALLHLAVEGLSPLARGNLNFKPVPDDAYGPIPARTGQPGVARYGAARYGAYPRSHGATFVDGGKRAFVRGLSPLARGNRLPAPSSRASCGPIPARTGQPRPLCK